jgi:uncharacterized membrane protein YjfL (UPF0719 family)
LPAAADPPSDRERAFAPIMNWPAFGAFAAYAGIGILALILWWVLYDRVLTPGYGLRESLFGRRPNAAVALDFLGGMLAMGVLAYGIIAGPQLESLAKDLEMVALSLLAVVLLLAAMRLSLAALLRLWFRSRRDAQGDRVAFNNELFRQRNTATGLFATSAYLILAAGLAEQDFLNLAGNRWPALWNILGVWLMGMAVILLHSWFYLGLASRRHILHECFHDNNPAAAFSLLGLVAGMTALNHGLLGGLRPGEHMLNTPELWYYLGAALALVLALRLLLQGVLWLTLGVSLRGELTRDNVAWGLLDGGLIFSLFLILIALIV